MNAETQFQDNKSLRLLQGGKAGWVALAADCVCFANAAGGVLRIGIEDGACAPPAHQRIEQAMLTKGPNVWNSLKPLEKSPLPAGDLPAVPADKPRTGRPRREYLVCFVVHCPRF